MGAGIVTVRTTVLGAGRGSRGGAGGGAVGRVATGRGASRVLDGLGDGSGLGFAVFCGFVASSFCWSW